MTGRMSGNIKRLIIGLLILTGFSSAGFSFQKKIIVNENIYKRVVGGGAVGTDFVIVDDLVNFDKFKIGDTILIIQMKGLQIDVPETGSYATPHNSLGSPGKYEFMIIESTDNGTRKVTFRNNLTNNYDIRGDVQIIRVPSYNSALVDAAITCPPWDSISKSGGVLTMIVGKTLKLNANIDVSGKGFAGGAIALGDGLCSDSDPANLQKYAYSTGFTNSGFKGEGIVSQAWIDATTQIPIYPDYAKGKGMNFNGGGGGNGRFSGGGGGSNYGAGGKGGRENPDICSGAPDPGLGGRQIKSTALVDGIYLGGGGGGSTYSAGGTSSTGGIGGGIVIIICNDIEGNGHIINTDGITATQASGTAGAGGGGAGGSIALYLENFSTATNLTLSAKGAKGGNNTGNFGEGGGGGGGLIWISNVSVPGNITRSITGGIPGTRSGGSTATPGAIGENLTTFVPILNGFLFNSIRSTGTNDQTDSICSDQIPYQVTGTKPVGGSGSYTYLWQRKNDSGGLPVNIASSNIQNFTFSAPEADTFFIRRIVKDEGTLLTDTSKWVEIRVQSFIKNNNIVIESDFIGPADTICYNGDPKLIRQLLPDLTDGNPKYYLFDWQDSTSVSAWMSNGGTLKDYNPPPGLLRTTWYKRKVTSGRCIDKTAIVKVTVLDTISKNIITTRFDTICHGGTFVNLLPDPGLSGGDNTYRFLWEYSQTGLPAAWSIVPGGSNNAIYDPDESSPWFPGTVYYRRTVSSGKHDVCVNISQTAVRQDWPVIAGNNISADQTICSGSIPVAITGPEPSNGAGSGTFKYTWQDSTRFQSWTDIPGFIKVPGMAGEDYTPPSLSDTTRYRRIAYSSKCYDFSKSRIINVHKPITNNLIYLSPGVVDSTICNGASTNLLKGLKPSGGTGNTIDNIFKWEVSPDKTNWNPALPGDSIYYQPGLLLNATVNPVYFYYRRNFTSGKCSSISDTITIKVLPKITGNNISAVKTAVCYNTAAQLMGPGLTGGDGIPVWLWEENTDGSNWVTASGTSNQKDYSRILTDTAKFRRIIFSGPFNCCKDTSNVLSIDTLTLPVGKITSIADTSICDGTLTKIKTYLTQAAPWEIEYTDSVNVNPQKITITKHVDSFLVYPATTASTTQYRYKLVSVTDNNGCKAVPVSISGSRIVNVYKWPRATIVTADPRACGPEYHLTYTPSVGTGTWYKVSGPGTATFSPNVNAPDKVTVDSTGAAWSDENIYTFKWREVNWQCADSAFLTISFYKRTGLVNAGPDEYLYSFDKVDTLRALKPLVGTGLWSVISGTGTISNDSIVSNLSDGANKFEWTVINGACISKDQVVITVYDLIIPEGFSPNNDLINDEFVIQGLDIAYNEVSLRILNSAGTEVFFTSNANGTWSNWKGENENGALPEGTYYYLLTIKSKRTNTVFNKSGFIILKRYNSQ